MMQQVYKTLPDDEPILSLCVVEDPTQCPYGYYVVHRTHDQDSDADLYRQSVLFGKRNTRYLCLSKVDGIADLIVESVAIIGEKDLPPASFCVIAKTMDSDQKAWRKSQLCYKVSKRSLAASCVTDVILLSRMKKAPDGFQLGGEINGLTLCFKVGSVTCIRDAKNGMHRDVKPPISHLGYSLNPKGPATNGNSSSASSAGVPNRRAPAEKPPSLLNGSGHLHDPLNDESPHEYEKLVVSHLSPKRPAPQPPLVLGNVGGGHMPSRPAPKLPVSLSTYATLGSYQGLEGVPFVLNSKLQLSSISLQVPPLKFRTLYELEKEFEYDFRLERQTSDG